ncbi:disease resistance protein RPP2A-like [Quercus lobata]|uniref:disease resistance protein RPP2A-like n=1 Tax=Quercus lobata TaxID=97700 RepID=UPI00124843EE|nr:disease resistance protein RPP2A-like [Quercus lobata]XP_030938859.1 disease resistance protein RPP2A-like [Quercus lobata]
MIKERLHSKRFLLILDDVDKSKQIENLLGNCDWFVSGSRVLITTRDAHLLATLEKDCTTYKVKELDKREALELFNQHAFRGNKLEEDYFELANQVIRYAGGLPLALTIIGSDLCGRKKSEWKGAIHQYGKIPKGDVHEILKVSYDGLEETEKDIFLDIACFFKGRDNNYVVNILDACNLYPTFGIPNLVNKCLITIGYDGKLWMHDLVQQMGREIVRQESPKILKKRSRLWHYEDSLEVLTESKGSDKIQGLMLDLPNPITVQLHAKAFRKMKNLKFLIVRNVLISEELKYLPNGLKLLEWHQYPFSLPSNYCLQQLVVLEMPRSCIRLEKLFKQGFQYQNMKSINLRECASIRKLPDLCAPNLETLDISGCENLIEVHEAIGSLDKLKIWYFMDCKKLQILPSSLRMKSLECFSLCYCISIEKFPNIHPEMKCSRLYLSDSNIREWPLSLGYLIRALTELYIDNCQDLGDFLVRCSGYEFTNLRELQVWKCDGNIIESHILMKPDSFPSLKYLDLDGCSIVTIPRSISRFTRLRDLSMCYCKKLQEIPRLPQSIISVSVTDCILLDMSSSCRLLNQFGEIYMNPSFSDDGCCRLDLPRIEIPKGFKLNHQSDGNSVSFVVGREFQKLILCFAFGSMEVEYTKATCFVVSTNGFSKEETIGFKKIKGGSEHLYLGLVRLRKWNESNPSEQNHVTITVEIKYCHAISSSYDPKITWLGVHVNCICCPQNMACFTHPSARHGCGSSLVPDDIDHHSFPSDVGFSDRLDLGSSSVAQAFDNNDSDFNLFPTSKKTRTS